MAVLNSLIKHHLGTDLYLLVYLSFSCLHTVQQLDNPCSIIHVCLRLAHTYYFGPKGLIMTVDLPTAPKIKNREREELAGGKYQD